MVSYLGLLLVPIVGVVFFRYGKTIHKNEYRIYFVFLALSTMLMLLIVFNVDVRKLVGLYEVYYSGHLSFALFTLVMAGGAFKKRHKLKIAIMRVRREMAILGFITVLPHAFLRLDLALSGFNSTGLIALLIIMPLVVTSLPIVRKKMQPRMWKRVHYLAYIVYALIYIHLVFDLFVTSEIFYVQIKSTGWVYLMVFTVYLMMKIRVIVIERKPKST